MTFSTLVRDYGPSSAAAGLSPSVHVYFPQEEYRESTHQLAITSRGSRPCSNDDKSRLVDVLIGFGLENGAADDDGIQWPSRRAIQAAFRWLNSLDGLLPDSIVPNGEGGIVLERTQRTSATEKIEISSTGQSEYFCFENCKLTVRQPVEP
jgi:hypothetical protein